MARSVRMIDVFLSCPSDVLHEKQLVVNLAEEWNSLHGKAKGSYINVSTWENVVSSSIADRAQSVINDQIGDNYDVYLGIMWSRFGAPTGRYESGTVEEFERALQPHRVSGNVNVAMFFKDAPIPLSNLDGDQFDRVKKFKARYGAEGGVYQTFVDDDSLRIFVNRLFERATGGLFENTPESGVQDENVEQGRDHEGEREKYNEMGLLDWNEEVSRIVGFQVEYLARLSERMESNTSATQNPTDEIDAMVRFGVVDADGISKIMGAVADSLNSVSEYIENGLSAYVSRNKEIVKLTVAGFDIINDFDDEKQKAEWKKSVLSVVDGLSANKLSAESLIETIAAMPRLAVTFNKARKRFIKNQSEMIKDMSRTETLLREAVRRAEEQGW